MGGAPVGGDEPAEAELLAQHGGQQVGVLAGVGAVDGAVGAHHRGRGALLHGVLESRQVDLLHGAVADDRVVGRRVAAGFLVVHREVLDLGHHAGRLDALDVRGAEHPVEIGVFADRLEGAPPAGVAHDVDGGAEVDGGALGGLLRADHLAVELLGGGVPGRRGVHRSGQLRDGAHAVTHPGRAVLQVHRRDAQRSDGGREADVAGTAGPGEQGDFLRCAHMGEQLADPLRDRRAGADPRTGGRGGGGWRGGPGHGDEGCRGGGHGQRDDPRPAEYRCCARQVHDAS